MANSNYNGGQNRRGTGAGNRPTGRTTGTGNRSTGRTTGTESRPTGRTKGTENRPTRRTAETENRPTRRTAETKKRSASRTAGTENKPVKQKAERQKEAVEKKTGMKKKRRKKLTKKQRIIRRVLLGIFFAFFAVMLVIAILVGIKFRKYENEARKIVKDGGIAAFKQNQTSTIYDKNGSVITELSGSHDAYYLEDQDIPQYVKQAFITTEDRRFYSHAGVDLKAIMRAVFELVRNKGEITQGGSTITQQLARNVYLSYEVSMDRKVKEMFIAREIEKRYSKKQILEFYINNINFGNGFYGVEAAARGYFDRSVSELSLAQIAYICSIPNNPTLYNPFTNGQNTEKRKDRILRQMYEQKDITKEEYDSALAESIVLNPAESSGSDYIETYTIYCATQALMKESGFKFKYYFRNKSEEEAYDEEYEKLYNQFSSSLYTGGYKIYTSFDMQKQETLQKSLDAQLESYDEKDKNDIYAFQGSATCIDNETGKVVAIVGGRSQKHNGYTLNRAFQSYRQPGSTIKPILVYTPAFEKGRNPRTQMSDEPIKDGPVNSPNQYDGDITLRYAVEKSKNTIAWNLFLELGIGDCIAYLRQMNFHRIVPDDYVAPMSIGGMTYGVSTLEMASAYATLENDGVFRSPTCIDTIMDVDGNTIIDNMEIKDSRKCTVEKKKIYEINAARMMTDVLTGVLTRGTGTRYDMDNAVCAAKTGTTNDNKDVWLCGYSTYYTTAVWVGYDMPREINDGVGSRCAGYIWQDYMSKIHKGLPIQEFEEYEVSYDIDDEEEEETSTSDETTTGTAETTKSDQKETTKKQEESGKTETTKAEEGQEETTAPEENTSEELTETIQQETEGEQEETTEAEKPPETEPAAEQP